MTRRMPQQNVLIRELRVQEKDRKGVWRALSTAFTLTRYHASPEFSRAGEFLAEGGRALFDTPEVELRRRKERTCLVAEVKGEVVGYEASSMREVMPGVSIAVYGGFAVVPEWQNKGIGKKLIQETTRQFLEKGLVFGEVSTDACAWPAIRTYESVGLRITGQQLTYTVHPSEAEPGKKQPIRRAEDDRDAVAIQRINRESFIPYKYYIHREFPVADYNAHTMNKLSSCNHLEEIKKRLGNYLLIEKDGETVGYLETSSSDRAAEFFGKRLTTISPKVPQGLGPETLASAVRVLADEGADVIDITVDYLENRKIRDAVSEVGFRFIYSMVDLTGRIQ